MSDAHIARDFSYRCGKDGQVFISWQGRVVTTLRGEAGGRFLIQVEAGDEQHAQQVMARATGNFKRGNERHAKRHNRHE